jgi:hypothetical protein
MARAISRRRRSPYGRLRAGSGSVALEAEEVEQLHRMVDDPSLFALVAGRVQHRVEQPVVELPVMGDPHVVEHAHLVPEPDGLEGAADAQARNRVRRLAGDRLAVKDDLAFAGRVDAGDEVKNGGLAGAVGANQADQLAGVQLQLKIVDGAQTAEVVGQIVDCQ